MQTDRKKYSLNATAFLHAPLHKLSSLLKKIIIITSAAWLVDHQSQMKRLLFSWYILRNFNVGQNDIPIPSARQGEHLSNARRRLNMLLYGLWCWCRSLRDPKLRPSSKFLTCTPVSTPMVFVYPSRCCSRLLLIVDDTSPISANAPCTTTATPPALTAAVRRWCEFATLRGRAMATMLLATIRQP